MNTLTSEDRHRLKYHRSNKKETNKQQQQQQKITGHQSAWPLRTTDSMISLEQHRIHATNCGSSKS